MSPLGRVVLGTLFAAPGVLTALVATGTGPFSAQPGDAPPWVGLVGASLFVVVGLWFWTAGSKVGRVVEALVGPWVLVGLLTILHWVAFGPGVRECTGGFSLPFVSGGGPLSGMQCRLGFGAGAVFFDGLLGGMLLDRAAERWLEGRAQRAVKGVSTVLILGVLSPFLILVAVMSLLREGWRRVRGAE